MTTDEGVGGGELSGNVPCGRRRLHVSFRGGCKNNDLLEFVIKKNKNNEKRKKRKMKIDQVKKMVGNSIVTRNLDICLCML